MTKRGMATHLWMKTKARQKSGMKVSGNGGLVETKPSRTTCNVRKEGRERIAGEEKKAARSS